MVGNIYLIPTPISEDGYEHLAAISSDLIGGLKLFFVENVRESRRFIKKINPDSEIDSLTFIDIGKYSEPDQKQMGLEKIWAGENAGLMSDAGLPGVGDPGHDLVLMAQDSGVRVVPIAGPNSFIMALMASGLNGQRFRFHGYLEIDKGIRKSQIRDFASEAQKTGESQIFMDTPYRNQQVLDDILKNCPGNVLLCIASEITGKNESIVTMPVSDWKKMKKKMTKVPVVFILGFKK